jgi:hypothetical protein
MNRKRQLGSLATFTGSFAGTTPLCSVRFAVVGVVSVIFDLPCVGAVLAQRVFVIEDYWDSPSGRRKRHRQFLLNTFDLGAQQVIRPIHMAACGAASRDYVFDGPQNFETNAT